MLNEFMAFASPCNSADRYSSDIEIRRILPLAGDLLYILQQKLRFIGG